MGIDYGNERKQLNLNRYYLKIKNFLKKNNTKIIFEPGRSIIANCGYLISKIIYIKEGSKKEFVILDAAMNDLMRPALYNAKHRIIALNKNNKEAKKDL